MPQMKLIESIRINGRVKKKYEINTPLNRVLKLKDVCPETKTKLIKIRDAIDIVRLSEEIEELTEELFLAYEKKLKKEKNHA